MSLYVKAFVANPCETLVTMTITMPLGEWMKLRAQLGSDYPGWKLGDAISSLALKMHQTIEPDAEQTS